MPILFALLAIVGTGASCATPLETPQAPPRTEPMSPGQTAVATGVWGGDHIGLTVTDSGAQLEFDCATGEITRRLTVDASGRGLFDGLYVQERGGPVRLGQEPERQAARYAARVAGTTLTLDVTLSASGTAVGSFSLTHGRTPRVKKCR